ncbi:MAG: RND family transporter [Sandaracinaceae bacterium]
MKGFLSRLADTQHDKPWGFVLVSLLLGGLSLPLILGLGGLTDGLTLNSDFTALLPETAPSVIDMEEIQARFGGQLPITMTVEADDEETLHRYVRALAPRIETLEEEGVAAVDWNVGDFADFVEENQHLYAELDDLTEIRDALDARLERERARANPFYIDLEDEEDEQPPEPEEVIERIESGADEARAEMESRFPDGFIQHPERTLVLVVVKTTISGGDAAKVDALRAAIEAEMAGLDPEVQDASIEVHWGGTLMEVRQETESLVAAVRNATALTIGLVMLAIYIFFLRIRPIPLLGLALIPPVLVTFGFAELTVDYLNASSAFMSAIVVGNGINPNVIWLARYFELRRQGMSVGEALKRCHTGTWKGTLTASLAAGVAYGSLIGTDYRGFRDFGIVGGMGMLLCWLAAYLLLPSLVVISERLRPLTFDPNKTHRGVYGVLFAKLALGNPRGVLIASLLVTVVAGGLVGYAVLENPLENDFRNLRSEREPDSDVEYVIDASRAILDDTKSGSALAVLAPTTEDVPRFLAQLEAYREAHPRAMGQVENIRDMLPEDQEQKLEVLAELRSLMLEIRPRVEEELQAQIDRHLPPEAIAVLTPDDLPESVAGSFTERDGSRGRLIFIEHHPEENSWDGLYLSRWAAAARSLRSEGADGPPPVAGTAVVFGDLTETVWRDGPRAIGIACVATILLLALTFRSHKQRWLTLASLLVGILWMAATMAGFGMRLNFLNFVAFPITFGNGADYGVNVMRRYADETEGGMRPLAAVKAAVEGTGGAVILCSLTTVIGYISLYTSSNHALNSFGAAMAISEVTCLAAAVLALPAGLALLANRGQSPGSRAADEAAS